MKMPRDFFSGYATAVRELGQEGDHRCADWSAPYAYLKERLSTFEPVNDNDLADRLRYRGGICIEAADEIEKLRKLAASRIDI